MKNISAIILAAGRGTRMKSRLPKPLFPLYSRPMLDYLIDAVKKVGVKRIVLVLGYGIDRIKKAFSDFEIVYQKRQLGSADAIMNAKKYFLNYSGDILVLYSDTPLLRPTTLKGLIAVHRKGRFACTILTAKVKDPAGYGRVIREGGRIIKIVEEKDLASVEKDADEINIGVYVFATSTLFSHINRIRMNPKKKEYYLTDIVNILREAGAKVGSFTTRDPLEGIGVNSRVELAEAHRILTERTLRMHMKRGVTIVDPATTRIDPQAAIGRDTVIYPHTIIENDVKIGRFCKIGPFARIRPGTEISNAVEIGNFVELVRTKVGKNSKIKHKTYLGDTDVGESVNIGAGTITANFDGKNKLKTIIEDKAFIGVGAILIAPVKIGKGAIVGAGSVVTKRKNIPPGKTVVGVPARILNKKR